jgi:predicted nuclease of predicted toxin-antitoxin system
LADRIAFHLDEHVDPAIAVALRRAGIDVTTTNEAGLRTSDDLSQLAYACAMGRVIVTRDTDFLRIADRTPDHPGVAFYSADQSIREIIEGLILIYEVLTPEEMGGHVEYL